MALQGITYDRRSEVSEESEGFMRDYFTSSDNDAHLRVARPDTQYLLYHSDILNDLDCPEVNSDYFLVEESGDITRKTIRPVSENDYRMIYLNGKINEEEITWREAEEIISAI